MQELTDLVRKQQIVAWHQSEQNQIIEENSINGSLVDDWAQPHKPQSEVIWVEYLPRNLTSCGCPTKPLKYKSSAAIWCDEGGGNLYPLDWMRWTYSPKQNLTLRWKMSSLLMWNVWKNISLTINLAKQERLCECQCNFNKHRLTHTEEKPYQCNICDKSYKSPDILKQNDVLHA